MLVFETLKKRQAGIYRAVPVPLCDPPCGRRSPLEGYDRHRLVPMRWIGQPREIADAVLYLAFQKASYITGTTLSVAGWR